MVHTFQYKLVVQPKSVDEFLRVMDLCKKLGFWGLTENSKECNVRIFNKYKLNSVITFDQTDKKGIRIGWTYANFVKTSYPQINIVDYNGFLKWLRKENYMDKIYQ